MDVQPFGKYLLDREIARGGMARVWLARLRGLGGFEKRLVVRQILPHLASDPRFVAMFVEEAKTLVQMSHPHIAPVFELGVVDGIYFLAMEYVEGATLADVLEEGPLPPALAAHIGVQIADALAYAHERFAIVHRDVTPRNVMIDGAGHCRLLDFGIAAPAEGEGEGELFGTPGYLSPEQARGENVGATSDLFSLGAVLHHALGGSAPHDTKDITTVRELRPGAPAPALPESVAPPELRRVVSSALDPDPKARPENARAMGRALRGWLAAQEPEGVLAELGARAERARERREKRRASERPPALGEHARRDPSGSIRTLAASRELESLLDGTAPLPRPAAAPRESAPDDAGPSTVPIAREPSSGIAVPKTPVARRETRSEPPRTPLPEPRATLPFAIGGVALLGLLVALGVSLTLPPAPLAEGERDAGFPLDASAPSEPDAGVDAGAADAGVDAAIRDAGPPDAGAEAPRLRARLTITCDQPSTEVTIDGRRVGFAPIRDYAVTPGEHTIVAVSPALGWRESATIRIGAGETIVHHMTLRRPE